MAMPPENCSVCGQKTPQELLVQAFNYATEKISGELKECIVCKMATCDP
jgi:hypothetical protein